MMRRRWMAAAWRSPRMPGPGLAGGARQVGLGGGLGLALRRQDPGGWTSVPLPARQATWEVKDGVIEGSGGQSMLYSPRGDYKNFKYRAEVKINDKGNSGMYVRTPKEARPSRTATRSRSTPRTATRSRRARCTPWSTSKSPSSRPTPGSPRRSRSPTSTIGARWSRSSGSRSTASCSSSTSTTTGSGRKATSPSSSTTRAARSRSARSR